MLLRTIFLLALISLLSETVVHGAGALAQTALRFRASAAARTQIVSAVSVAENAIARAVASNEDPHSMPVPSPVPTCVASDSTGCRLSAQAQIAIPSVAPQATPGTCPATNCTVYLQANDTIAEGRIPVNVSATVNAADGTVLATRNATVLFRTFSAAPYVALAGSLDATLDDIARQQNGDDGGATNGATTLVNVEYLNAEDPSATPVPGNVWRSQNEHPAAAANAWDY